MTSVIAIGPLARSFDAFPVLGVERDPPTGGAGGAGRVAMSDLHDKTFDRNSLGGSAALFAYEALFSKEAA